MSIETGVDSGVKIILSHKVHKEIHACERVLINVVAENVHCPTTSSDLVRFTGVYNLLTCYIVMQTRQKTTTTTKSQYRTECDLGHK